MLEPDCRSPVRLAFVLVDGFHLHELSRALAAIARANTLSHHTKFEATILTLDDCYAASSWNVSVVPTTALCAADTQDYVLLCMDEDAVDQKGRLEFLLKCFADGRLAKLISTERASINLVPDTLRWLDTAAPIQKLECERYKALIASNKFYSLSTSVTTALIQRYCGPHEMSKIAWNTVTSQIVESASDLALKRPKRLNDALRIMAENLEEPLTIREIGARVGCSSRHLLRWFDAYLSTTPTQFYATLRLDRACHLLFNSNMSVTDIAAASGYQWAAQFSKAFRRRFGHSPRMARKSISTARNANDRQSRRAPITT